MLGKLLVHITYANRSVVGHDQRFRVSMGANASNLGNTSAWTYFRVTS